MNTLCQSLFNTSFEDVILLFVPRRPSPRPLDDLHFSAAFPIFAHGNKKYKR